MLTKLARGVGIAAIGIALLGYDPAGAATITGCVANNGNLSISSTGTCPRGQTSLSWNTTGPAGPAGPGALMVYDANDKVIGPLFGPRSVLLNPTGTGIVALSMVPAVVPGRAGFSGFATIPEMMMYTSSDCTGTAYLNPGTAAVSGDTLYYPQMPWQDITINSYAFGSQCMQISAAGSYGEMASFNLSTLGLVPPFTVR
jgi:hypothetical protein